MRKTSRKPGEPHCRDCNTVTHQVRFSKPLGHGQCQKLQTHSIKKPGRRFLCTGGHEWESIASCITSNEVDTESEDEKEKFVFVIAPEDEDWFPLENSDEGGDNNNNIINEDWSMGDVEYGRWINQFDDADESWEDPWENLIDSSFIQEIFRLA